jgi:hypothetical protein
MATMANFSAAAQQELQNASQNYNYVNSRYARTGNEQVGKPFPLYKQPAGYFTEWRPSGAWSSTTKKEFNLPTNNNFYRTAVINDALSLGNNDLYAWTNRTQTLATNGDTLACNNNADCQPWPGTTCNSNYENWPSAKGNQSGGYCSTTMYPELQNGNYFRKNINQGGIGRACSTDTDCGQGYACNNEVDFNGKNVQQTGYCAQRYQCPDGSINFLGTPYNSGIPQPPPMNQNNNGQGYKTKDQCSQNAQSQQNCVQNNTGAWFAVYPGYCGVAPSLRKGSPTGPVRTSSPNTIRQGLHIPAYATVNASNLGNAKSVASFTAWNIPSAVQDGSTEAWSYSTSLDPPFPNA